MEGEEKTSNIGVKRVADHDLVVVGFILVVCALEAGLVRILLAAILTRFTSPAMASATLRLPVAAVEDFFDEMAA